MIKYVDGDLIKLALDRNFDVIGHGCNCFCTMGAGIAPQMAKAFWCNDPTKYPWEGDEHKGDYRKLGNFEEYSWYLPGPERHRLDVLNMYTQYKYGSNHADGDKAPFDYNAFAVCLFKVNKRYAGKRIGLPRIGAGLAGGDWYAIERIIREQLVDCDVTIVNYKTE